MLIQSMSVKIASSTRLESSSLDRVWIESLGEGVLQEDLGIVFSLVCLDHCKD